MFDRAPAELELIQASLLIRGAVGAFFAYLWKGLAAYRRLPHHGQRPDAGPRCVLSRR